VFLSRSNATFASPSVYGLAGAGTPVLADFDGDGVLDIAKNIGNGIFGAGFLVMLNRGDGTFKAAVQYSTGTGLVTVSLTAGDFFHEGRQSIATIDVGYFGYQQTLSVFRNQGNGTFVRVIQRDLSLGAESIIAADVDGDGYPDLVTENGNVGDSPDGSVSILLNTQHGDFAAPIDFPARSCRSLTLADLNNDGRLDMVVSGTTWVRYGSLLNSGGGHFAPGVFVPYFPFAFMSSLVVADFDGDGLADIASSPGGISDRVTPVSILHGNGDGTFQDPPISIPFSGYPAGPLATADFDRDGTNDIVMADNSLSTTPRILIMLNRTPLQLPVISLQLTGRTVAPGHAVTLTATATPGPATFQWYLGASGNTAKPIAGATSSVFRTPPLADTTTYWVRATNRVGSADSAAVTITIRALRLPDLDGNGRADILWHQPLTGEDGVWTMNGAQIVTAQSLPGASPAWEIAGTGDLNGDGISDLVWRNAATGENGVWLMGATAIFSAQPILGTDPLWEVAAVADFNGDGKADILWRNPQSGENKLWLMNGFTIVDSRAIPGAAPPWEIAGVGDFNGDHRNDILWRNPFTGENGLWLMDGFAIVGTQALPAAPLPWQVVGVADFNDDAKADILWRNPQTGDDGLWLMNSFQILAAQTIPTGGPPWQIVGVGDLNGDGFADILWRNPQSGDNAVWLMNGFAIQDARAIPGAGVGWEIR
jgi:hypothetical protein